jgi:hypothetical protein
LVADKETKMRESMKIMSLNWFAYSFSYYMTQFLVVCVLALALVLSVWLPIQGKSGFGSVLVFAISTLAFGMSLLSLSMWISTLFSDAKLSATIGQLLVVFPSSIAMAVIAKNIAINFPSIIAKEPV